MGIDFVAFSGELLGSLCKRFGAVVYEYFHEFVLDSIRINLERSSILNANESKELLEKLAVFHNQTAVRYFVEILVYDHVFRKISLDGRRYEQCYENVSRHCRMASFRNELEVKKFFSGTFLNHDAIFFFRALHSMIEGCGIKFLTYINDGLIELIFKTVIHTNRFVRELGFLMLASILASFNPVRETGMENISSLPKRFFAFKSVVAFFI